MDKQTQNFDASINKVINSKEFKDLLQEGGFGCRVSIRFNGKEMLGTSIAKAPENHEELVKFLKELVGFLEAPDVEDKELF